MTQCDILIIDDDADDIDILSDALHKSGIEKIHCVHSSEDAFRYLQQVYPHCIPKVIITDFFLSRTTAIEFVTEINSMIKYKKVKVIVLSSSKSDVQAKKLRELNVVDYFEKPTQVSEYTKVANYIKSQVEGV